MINSPNVGRDVTQISEIRLVMFIFFCSCSLFVSENPMKLPKAWATYFFDFLTLSVEFGPIGSYEV